MFICDFTRTLNLLQRKFRENDEEDSYFSTDDDEDDKSHHTNSQSTPTTALGTAHITSIGETGQESDVERAIQLECKLGLAMVQYSSSSDEDDDDVLSSERSNIGTDNNELPSRNIKRTLLGSKRPKIQVFVNSNKNKVPSNSSSQSFGQMESTSSTKPSSDDTTAISTATTNNAIEKALSSSPLSTTSFPSSMIAGVSTDNSLTKVKAD